MPVFTEVPVKIKVAPDAKAGKPTAKPEMVPETPDAELVERIPVACISKSFAALPGETVNAPASKVPITVRVLAEALEPKTILVNNCKVELAATVKFETVMAVPA